MWVARIATLDEKERALARRAERHGGDLNSNSPGSGKWDRPISSLVSLLAWVVSAAVSRMKPPFSSLALRSLHGRPGRSGSFGSIGLQSPWSSLFFFLWAKLKGFLLTAN